MDFDLGSTPSVQDELFLTEQRTDAFLRRAAVEARSWYDNSGQWTGPGSPAASRERYWLAPAFLRNGQQALGNAIIRETRLTRYKTGRFEIFSTNIAISLLVQESKHLEPDVHEELTAIAREGLGFKPGDRQPDFQFHGFNDNMPAKATMGLILGGEFLGLRDVVEYGVWNLKQMRAMLTRRGINSEFNSPTYTPLTIRAISEIAEFAKSEEAREIALQIETRLWIDLAARFHPEMGVLCGPGSRCYTVDNLAHMTCAAMLFWFVLGERAHPSPMEIFNPDRDLVLHHLGSVPFNTAQAAYLATGHYHIPEAAQRMMIQKQYPFRASASYEVGSRPPTSPASAGHIETHLEPDFAIGCASFPYAPGMTNSGSLCYQATYRRTNPVRSHRDVATVFNKMLCGEEPGTILENPPSSGEQDYLPTWGQSLTVSAGRTALVLNHPYAELANREIEELNDTVIFPSHSRSVDELIVGGVRRVDWSGSAKQGEWIVCRRGRLLIGLRPLTYSAPFGKATLTLRRNASYEWLSMGLYNGTRRMLTEEDLSLCFGGFVAEHASVDDYPSLEAFAEFLSLARFEDYFWTTRRVRYVREGMDIEVSWDPKSQLPRYATIDGRLVNAPVVEIDGLLREEIPFIDQPPEPPPMFFPWEDFELGWTQTGKAWKTPAWAIGDRG